MSIESADPQPDIRVKETIDETPMRGRGFAHVDIPHASFGIDPQDEISSGEVTLDHWDDEIMLTFQFDSLGVDFSAPSREFGFYLDADTAELLAGWLGAYAEWVRTGDWTHPEADDV